MRHTVGRSEGRIGLMKRFPTRQEHPLSSAGSGLQPTLPTCLPSCHAPQKPPLSGSPARPQSLPGVAEPSRLRQPACRKAASQPTAGRAWLWRNFRNPYNFIGRTGYLWLEPQKSPSSGNIMILQKTSSPMVEPQTSRAGSSGQ